VKTKLFANQIDPIVDDESEM